MKRTCFFLGLIICLFININGVYAQTNSVTDLSNRQVKKMSKKEKKAERKRLDKAYVVGRRWRIGASYIDARLDSYIQFEGLHGVLGAKLSLEDLLGFKKNKLIPKIDFQYAFNRRSSLYAEYYNIARKSTHDVNEDFDWGEIEIPDDVGEVDLFLNTQIWSFGYMYSFINNPHAELSFFINTFILGVKTGLDVDSRDIHSRFSITAPLPSFGYRFNYEILPKVRFGGTHSLFFLQIGGYGGTINNFKLNLDYQLAKWVRAGISYSNFALDISAKGKYFNGFIKYAYEGPGLHLYFNF